ncbi:hypothetical protein GCM10010345_12380 [Streptomyces canarius]|uniref:Uncharacterized protein n=1 Tax=Streptomyces canarius TaxID=285453 RepID=A0ABQ3CJ61_9ACTN|nr:hypothetical protein GCM10010345_12380 [Streptomyces canarius]
MQPRFLGLQVGARCRLNEGFYQDLQETPCWHSGTGEDIVHAALAGHSWSQTSHEVASRRQSRSLVQVVEGCVQLPQRPMWQVRSS